MTSRAGRKRHLCHRQPNGQPSRSSRPQAGFSGASPIVTAAMARRLSDVGLQAVEASLARQVCRDPASGTAIGRLMWVYQPDGERARRMMPDGKTPVISDAMAAGAEVFVAAYVAWRAAQGLPRRYIAAAKDDAFSGPMTTDKTATALARWAAIRAAIDHCPAPRLVWAALDTVLIDNIPTFILDRPTGLAALQRGLEAVAGVRAAD